MAFTGFDPDALAFYAELRESNSKEWWTANRARYDQHVTGPFEDLAGELTGEFGEMKVFRPYRDVRFSADKSPYKLHIGMVTRARPAHYIQLSDEGLVTGGGAYDVPTAALARFREIVDDPTSGARLERLLADLDRRGFAPMTGDALRTAPRGYRPDHPRIELLRLRRLAVGRDDEPAPWMWSPDALEMIRERWRAVSLWCDWLTDAVGGELSEATR
ncbi:TIGR02453 family protein [Microbacterium sp. cf046]|uniref:DUF2461 domain-containing protein n=1 Tax=Microbacterium sp. cf046 TaxID=1761803 RepID=UPI0008E4B5E3|nr:DUF2461 domain-containing protein [Microbacterium sp. cf046]SFR87629.1 TIGR02453 family protein [Microbacterium sp. cf046]